MNESERQQPLFEGVGMLPAMKIAAGVHLIPLSGEIRGGDASSRPVFFQGFITFCRVVLPVRVLWVLTTVDGVPQCWGHPYHDPTS